MILVLNLDNVLLNGVTRLFDQAVLEETDDCRPENKTSVFAFGDLL